MWMATTAVAALALAWLRLTIPPEGFIQEPDHVYDYIIGRKKKIQKRLALPKLWCVFVVILI